MSGSAKISAAEKLRTLDLYIRLRNSNAVAEELGLAGPTVRNRLRVLGVRLLPQGYSTVASSDWNDHKRLREIREALEQEVAGSPRIGQTIAVALCHCGHAPRLHDQASGCRASDCICTAAPDMN